MSTLLHREDKEKGKVEYVSQKKDRKLTKTNRVLVVCKNLNKQFQKKLAQSWLKN